MQESNEGPAPMIKIDSFSISFFNSAMRVFFDSSESNNLDDRMSIFFEYPKSLTISLYLVAQPNIVI